MRYWLAGVVIGAGLAVAACGQNTEHEREIASLKAEHAALQQTADNLADENDQLQSRLRRRETEVREVRVELEGLKQRMSHAESEPEKPEAPRPEIDTELVDELRAKIADLEAEIEELKQRAETPDNDEGEEVDLPVKTLDPAVVERKVNELMPLVRAGDGNAMGELTDTLNRADKASRDDAIQRLRDWASDEPDNKHARLALAMVLTTRFRDLANPMEQGALASEVKTEIEKATEIDPDYYEARHFLAILKVNYPPFTPEFKEADKDLDKALELQQAMTWEDHFAEIYASYSMWHRMQNQLDEAAGWVQKGLDRAPRNQGLLDERARVEEARDAQEE